MFITGTAKGNIELSGVYPNDRSSQERGREKERDSSHSGTRHHKERGREKERERGRQNQHRVGRALRSADIQRERERERERDSAAVPYQMRHIKTLSGHSDTVSSVTLSLSPSHP
ncbi:hypothetical protein KIPB_016448, partial [Kipferlia bialata]|eukprot:g16448.t1